jgi:hypothetical protein
VSKHTWTEISGTPQNDDITVVYLVDSYNHTGFSQVLEELTYNKADPDPLTETPDSLTTYLIGDDVIAQTKDGITQYLLYDGHDLNVGTGAALEIIEALVKNFGHVVPFQNLDKNSSNKAK